MIKNCYFRVFDHFVCKSHTVSTYKTGSLVEMLEIVLEPLAALIIYQDALGEQ